MSKKVYKTLAEACNAFEMIQDSERKTRGKAKYLRRYNKNKKQ